MNTFIGTLAGVWPALFGQIQVLRNFDSLPVSRMKLALWPEEKCKGFWDNFELEMIVNCPLASEVEFILQWAVCPIKGHHKAILTFFFSSLCCIFGSLYFETLNWPLRAPLNTSAIIKAGQAIDWIPVNSAPLHILSSAFLVSHKVLNASSSVPEPSAVRGHYLHVSPAGSQHGRLGTRDGRAEGALRENIKVCPVPNVSWDD